MKMNIEFSDSYIRYYFFANYDSDSTKLHSLKKHLFEAMVEDKSTSHLRGQITKLKNRIQKMKGKP